MNIHALVGRLLAVSFALLAAVIGCSDSTPDGLPAVDGLDLLVLPFEEYGLAEDESRFEAYGGNASRFFALGGADREPPRDGLVGAYHLSYVDEDAVLRYTGYGALETAVFQYGSEDAASAAFAELTGQEWFGELAIAAEVFDGMELATGSYDLPDAGVEQLTSWAVSTWSGFVFIAAREEIGFVRVGDVVAIATTLYHGTAEPPTSAMPSIIDAFRHHVSDVRSGRRPSAPVAATPSSPWVPGVADDASPLSVTIRPEDLESSIVVRADVPYSERAVDAGHVRELGMRDGSEFGFLGSPVGVVRHAVVRYPTPTIARLMMSMNYFAYSDPEVFAAEVCPSNPGTAVTELVTLPRNEMATLAFRTTCGPEQRHGAIVDVQDGRVISSAILAPSPTELEESTLQRTAELIMARMLAPDSQGALSRLWSGVGGIRSGLLVGSIVVVVSVILRLRTFMRHRHAAR